jgi:hypothetical protein|tara:strand:- start:7560 stop:7760 length:201 start_codon:yes stop_codon:yes gene_type:complete
MVNIIAIVLIVVGLLAFMSVVDGGVTVFKNAPVQSTIDTGKDVVNTGKDIVNEFTNKVEVNTTNGT